MILRATPPVFDSRLIVLLNAGETTATAKGVMAMYAPRPEYVARTIEARFTNCADWQPGKLRWCYVEDVPALVASDAREDSSGAPGFISELSAARERTPEQQAQRDQEDEGAKGATAKQLKEALDGLGIKYPDNATKAALLALWTSRP